MSQSNNSARYFIQFDEKLARFLNNLASYIDRPKVNNIHDVRTAFRRLEACYGIFPSAYKTKSTENYLALGKRFFSLNSVVRDSDIMLKKLRRQKGEKQSSEEAPAPDQGRKSAKGHGCCPGTCLFASAATSRQETSAA